MVKEYIQEQVSLTEEKLAEKKSELKKVLDAEQVIRDKICRIQKESDMNFEIFSPRAGKISTRDQVRELEQERQKIETEAELLKKEVETLEDQDVNFQLMILEIEELEGK